MSPTMLVVIALAGAVGASARYAVDRAVNARGVSRVPWGTFIVNVTGSFALGVMLGLTLSRDVPQTLAIAIGAGFLGAYTTFSTWMYESVKLIESRAWTAAVVNVLAPLIAGPAAALAGVWLALQV